jgi:hypothetical protein
VGELHLMPSEFWRLTYAEFVSLAEGYKQRQTHRMNELIYLAWHVEAFARQKKMPPLKGLMQDTSEKRQQTDDEMMAACRILNAAFGGEVVEN